MSTSKSPKIEVNSSSIVDLKAELFRKQEEVRLKRNLNGSEKATLSLENFVNETTDDLYNKSVHKISRLSKKVLGVSAPLAERKPDKKTRNENSESKSSEANREMSREDEIALAKSRTMLEKKAKLYEQMASGSIVPDADNEELLVDFEQKSMFKYNNNSKFSASDEDDKDDDDGLVEYEDEFGRTRMVKRKDLPQTEPVQDHPDRPVESYRWTVDNHLLSEDMRREIERREWEEHTRQEMEDTTTAKSKIHYEDVREGEIRDHGVAFFNFSADDETRAKQMEMLEQMRDETEIKKSEKQRIKEKRKQMLKARLAKVAARKGIALPDDPSDQSDSEPEEKIITIEKARLKVAKDPVKVGRVRDWDLGKEGLFASRTTEARLASPPSKSPFISQQRYVEQRRDERNNDFAPPTLYHHQHKPTFETSKRFKPLDRPDVREDKPNYSKAPPDIAAVVGDKLSEIRRKMGP